MKFIKITGGVWREPKGKIYRCPVRIYPEQGGGYYVTCEALPGAASQGDTIPETLDNIQEALTGVIESYLASGEKIPWKEEDDEPEMGNFWRATVYVKIDKEVKP